MINNNLISDIEEFLKSNNITFEILNFEITEKINNLLDDLWLGSTSKIDMDLLHSEFRKIEFPNGTEIDDSTIIEMLEQYKFKILNLEKVILYFSGNNQCILLENKKFQNYIFDYMDNFCYLDTFILFNYEEIVTEGKISNLLEFRIFDYISGTI